MNGKEYRILTTLDNERFVFILSTFAKKKQTNPELIGVLESESAKNVHLFNPLKLGVADLNPLKTSENLKVF